MPIFNEAIFRKGVTQIGLSLTKTQFQQFKTYAGELELWNGRMNLVGGNLSDFTVRHLLDCLACLPVMAAFPHASILDIGSGAGLPGIPLAILLPGSSVALAERSGKKAGFLRTCAALLNLANVTVLESAWEDVPGKYDLITCRAFADLAVIAEAAAKLCRRGGMAAAYKGRREEIERELAEPEMQSAGRRASIRSVTVPFLAEERNLVILPTADALSDGAEENVQPLPGAG